MGKKSEKYFKENEFFLSFFCAERLCRIPIGDRVGRERPGEHVWAAKLHKHPGRSRPNRGFRPRSFCRADFGSAFFDGALRQGLGERNIFL
jgi:hypothetical protein